MSTIQLAHSIRQLSEEFSYNVMDSTNSTMD